VVKHGGFNGRLFSLLVVAIVNSRGIPFVNKRQRKNMMVQENVDLAVKTWDF
jgi:hypothetical protein